MAIVYNLYLAFGNQQYTDLLQKFPFSVDTVRNMFQMEKPGHLVKVLKYIN